MITEGARVFLVLPTARANYFEPGKYSTEWYARRALRTADRLSGGSGVEVFQYGKPASGRYVESGTALRTRVEPGSVETWSADWAVAPNAGLNVLEDRCPPSRLEETFAVSGTYSRPQAALRQVLSALKEDPAPALVIFRMDSHFDQEEIVLAARDTGARQNAFWQIFGWSHAIDVDFWMRDGLHRGRVLPNLHVHMDAHWSHRAVARRFSRWRKKTLG